MAAVKLCVFLHFIMLQILSAETQENTTQHRTRNCEIVEEADGRTFVVCTFPHDIYKSKNNFHLQYTRKSNESINPGIAYACFWNSRHSAKTEESNLTCTGKDGYHLNNTVYTNTLRIEVPNNHTHDRDFTCQLADNIFDQPPCREAATPTIPTQPTQCETVEETDGQTFVVCTFSNDIYASKLNFHLEYTRKSSESKDPGIAYACFWRSELSAKTEVSNLNCTGEYGYHLNNIVYTNTLRIEIPKNHSHDRDFTCKLADNISDQPPCREATTQITYACVWILRLFAETEESKLKCTGGDGYHLNSTVYTNSLRIEVPNNDLHDKVYVCQLADDNVVQESRRTTTTPETNDSAAEENNILSHYVITAGIAVFASIILMVIGVSAYKMCRRYSSRFCNTRQGAKAGGWRARRCCSCLRHAPPGSDDCTGRHNHPLLDPEIGDDGEKDTDWPPLPDLERQNEWIKDTLIPFVGCKVFPTNTKDAKQQLSDLTELQLSIQCRLGDLRGFDPRSCSEEVSKLKESVLAKLKEANELACKRCEDLKARLEDLISINHQVKNAHDKMDNIRNEDESSKTQNNDNRGLRKNDDFKGNVKPIIDMFNKMNTPEKSEAKSYSSTNSTNSNQSSKPSDHAKQLKPQRNISANEASKDGRQKGKASSGQGAKQSGVKGKPRRLREIPEAAGPETPDPSPPKQFTTDGKQFVEVFMEKSKCKPDETSIGKTRGKRQRDPLAIEFENETLKRVKRLVSRSAEGGTPAANQKAVSAQESVKSGQ